MPITFNDGAKWMIRIRQHYTFGFGIIAPEIRLMTMESEMETIRVLRGKGMPVPDVYGEPIGE